MELAHSICKQQSAAHCGDDRGIYRLVVLASTIEQYSVTTIDRTYQKIRRKVVLGRLIRKPCTVTLLNFLLVEPRLIKAAVSSTDTAALIDPSL